MIFLYFLISISLYSHACEATKASALTYDQIYQEAKDIEDYIISTRRTLHQHPETRFEEHETSQIIKNVLKDNNISYTEGWGVDYFNNNRGGTGIVADIGNGEKPCIIIRADIDALPIQEKTDVPFKSTHNGKMHACGHDAHTTMAIGAGLILKNHEDELEGTVRLMFTPAEEGGGGVKLMLDEGAHLLYPPAERAFGFHVAHFLPTGTICSKANSVTGGVDHLMIKVTGKGGHGGFPHLTIDPVPAALAIVRSLYDLYARETYFHEEYAGLVGITHFEAGNGEEAIIPEEVIIGGTVQGMRTSTLKHLKERIKTIVESIAKAYGCNATLHHRDVPYIAVENDPELYDFYKKVVGPASTGGFVSHHDAMFGGDDFSFFGEQFPSIYASIGIGSGGKIHGHPPTNASIHSANFCLDEAILTQGSAIHAHVAIQSIEDIKSKKAAAY